MNVSKVNSPAITWSASTNGVGLADQFKCDNVDSTPHFSVNRFHRSFTCNEIDSYWSIQREYPQVSHGTRTRTVIPKDPFQSHGNGPRILKMPSVNSQESQNPVEMGQGSQRTVQMSQPSHENGSTIPEKSLRDPKASQSLVKMILKSKTPF